MTWSSGPLPAGTGWVGWAVMALVVVAFWAVPIAATLALFPTAPRNRRHRRTGDHD